LLTARNTGTLAALLPRSELAPVEFQVSRVKNCRN
jgi:hypothetical protein